MSTVALIGAGSGGAAAVVDLTQRGHEVRWWNRSQSTIEPFRAAGVRYEGVLGKGAVRPAAIVDTVPELLDGPEVVMVCLPSLAHEEVALALATCRVRVPIVLNPGHTGGALHFATLFRRTGVTLPPLVELSTLTYVARKPEADSVRLSGVAGHVRAGQLPGDQEALTLAQELYPAARPVRDVLASSLANVNLVLHTPGAILSAAWVEATGGDFRFYVDAMTSGVVRTIEALDRERLAVAAAFGHELPSLVEEMVMIGTAVAEHAARGDTRAAIVEGEANRRITAPDSLAHRYYAEDFGYGLVPVVELARIAGVDVPLAQALIEVASTLLGTDLLSTGLNADRLGIAGLSCHELLDLVRGVRP